MQSTSDSASQQQPQNNNKKQIPDLDSERNAALNRQVANAVIKGLGYFGAGPVVESLVYILELEHSVDLYSLANNLGALRAALQTMFGGAAYVIEGKIADSLARQLGVIPDGKSLEDLVKILSEKLLETSPAEAKKKE